jgi:hypothetical protein
VGRNGPLNWRIIETDVADEGMDAVTQGSWDTFCLETEPSCGQYIENLQWA